MIWTRLQPLIGLSLLAGGLWWVYPPLSLIVLGAILIYDSLAEKKETPRK